MLLSIFSLAASYFIGALPFGVLVGKRLGVDVRTVGSGNTGATNVWRALGPRAGAAVFALDVAKGLCGPLLARGLGASENIVALCAVVAVVGHVFSIFLRGRGGKGVATALGAIFGLSAPVALIALALWGVVLGLSRWVSLASVVAAASVVVLPWMFHLPTSHAVVMGVMGLLAIAKHIPNIKRLLDGTEPKVGVKSAKVPDLPSSSRPAGDAAQVLVGAGEAAKPSAD